MHSLANQVRWARIMSCHKPPCLASPGKQAERHFTLSKWIKAIEALPPPRFLVNMPLTACSVILLSACSAPTAYPGD